MGKRTRMVPDERKRQILAAAVSAAAKSHYSTLTKHAVAEEAGVSVGLVSHYWNTMGQLRRAVMRLAVQEGNAPVVAQGLAVRDPQAHKATDAVKAAAADHIRAG